MGKSRKNPWIWDFMPFSGGEKRRGEKWECGIPAVRRTSSGKMGKSNEKQVEKNEEKRWPFKRPSLFNLFLWKNRRFVAVNMLASAGKQGVSAVGNFTHPGGK